MKGEVRKHLQYALGYLELKMYDEAVREADAALALQPDNARAIALKSAALWQANRLSEAEPFVAKLAELNPRESSLWINLAYIRRRTRSLDAAVETLQRAFDANPRDALAHFNMACYRAVQNRPLEAIELLKNAIHLDPKLKALARSEPDLDPLRSLPEFQRLLEER
jgi:tetratricopeptide (TPR) repeat protein